MFSAYQLPGGTEWKEEPENYVKMTWRNWCLSARWDRFEIADDHLHCRSRSSSKKTQIRSAHQIYRYHKNEHLSLITQFP